VLAATLRRLRGNLVVAAHLPRQRRIPFLPRERLDELRDRRIRHVVRWAARTVPYYRDLFRTLGLDPRAIRTAADLSLLPVLDKQLVRARPELFRSTARPARDALSFATSGSTGTPVRVWHDRRSLLANIAFGERERHPVNAVCGTFRPSELYVGYETSTFKKVTGFYAEAARLPIAPRRRFVPLSTPLEEVAAIANAERPDVLVGYGGWVDLFFRTIAARRIALHPPKAVMYMGEALPHGARAHVEGTFGIPVLSRYNAVESFKIGFTCAERTGFHVHEDLCHVRVVGSDGGDAPPGAPGQVVLTNLVNRATVLLNYPIGDVAALAPAPCPCGRTLRLLSELEGRVEDILPLEDGRFVHPREVWQVFKDDADVLQYQLVQREPRRFAVRLATVDDAAFARAAGRCRPALARLLGADARLDLRRSGELERADGVKFRAVASLCPRAGTDADAS
jgi:phenylacetate-CoA ligase